MKKTLSSKALLLLAVALVGVAIASSCKKSTEEMPVSKIPDLTDEPLVFNISKTNCKSHSKNNDKIHNPDTVFVTFNNNVINVEHRNMEVNCGFDTLIVNAVLVGDTIMVTEKATPNNANCYCDINANYQIGANNLKTVHFIIIKNLGVEVYRGIFNTSKSL